MAANPKNYWASEHNDGLWYVVQEGSLYSTSKHHTQAEAWAQAQAHARLSKGEAFLKGKDGTIRMRNTYGNDPARSVG